MRRKNVNKDCRETEIVKQTKILASTRIMIFTRYMLIVLITSLIADIFLKTEYFKSFIELIPILSGILISEFITKIKEEI